MSKQNYKLEGDIDFFAELQKSLLENEEESDSVLLCQISGLPLTENHFKMNCGHIFNYSSLYTEIYKQKFDFKTYTIDSLSIIDLRMFKASGLDYYIKCPYCRRIQTDLLPYYDNLTFPKKYGVNTTDVSFKVVDNSSYANSASYVYKVYGYTFTKGICCVTMSGIHTFQCFNAWVSEIPGLNKSYCTNHIRVVAKEYKLLEKEKITKEKALLKEAKVLAISVAKEAKVLEKAALKKNKLENKVIKKTVVITEFVPETELEELKCSALLKSGARKGAECGLKCVKNGFCGRHLLDTK